MIAGMLQGERPLSRTGQHPACERSPRPGRREPKRRPGVLTTPDHVVKEDRKGSSLTGDGTWPLELAGRARPGATARSKETQHV